MPSYRLTIEASVCLSVEAATEEEAVAKGLKIVEDTCDGMDLDLCLEQECDPGTRLYLHENVEVSDVQFPSAISPQP